MSVLVEFSMFPTDHGESKSVFVARIIDMIDRSKIPYKLGPMGTTFETDSLAEALKIIEQSYECLSDDCNRVYSSIKMDIRKESVNRMKSKIESVENHIGRSAEV